SLSHWILATFLLCLACSSRRIARELGVRHRTSYRWCWWLRNAALSYEMQRQLEGTVEADDLYHTAGNKGQAQGGGKKSLGRRARGRRKKREPGRGRYDKDRFCQVVEAEMLIRQAGASPRSYPPFRRSAPCLSVRPNSRIASASLADSRPLTPDAVAVESVG